MVADRDLVVGDWVLLPVSGSRDNDRLHIQTVTVDGPRNVLVTVREPDGNSTQ